VAGTGSVALRNYIILCLGKRRDDAIFLQVKEAQAPCGAAFLANVRVPRIRDGEWPRGNTVCRPSPIPCSAGRRSAISFSGPPTGRSQGGSRLRRVARSDAAEYAEVCGRILAKGHARTGDSLALAAYCGDSDRLDRAMVKFAVAYAIRQPATTRYSKLRSESGGSRPCWASKSNRLRACAEGWA